MEREVYDAALQGSLSQLTSIIDQDPLILHRCFQTNKSPLHISAEHNHLQFTLQLLRHNPQLTELLDSHKSSPLHSAASRGHIEIVKSLILVNPDICFVRDEDDRNPAHVAAVKGQVAVLDELVRSMPRAAKERAGKEGSILHLCVKYNKLECLMLVVNCVGDNELLNCKDCEGNTVLHLAVADKQIEMLKFLLSKNYWMDKNCKNNNGLTPMDTYLQSRRDPKSITINKILKHADLRSSTYPQPNENWNKHMKWLEDHRSSLMLVASLIAQMAFTAGLNPPGGLSQDTGYAIASKDKNRQFFFNYYLVACSVSLFSSLSIIIMLISGLPCRKLIVYVSMVTMWIAILPMPSVYIMSLIIFTPDSDVVFGKKADHMSIAYIISAIGSLVWYFLLLVLVVGHLISFIVWLVKKVWRCCCYY